jgi:hypothetical protein
VASLGKAAQDVGWRCAANGTGPLAYSASAQAALTRYSRGTHVVLEGILAVGAGRLLYNRPVLAVLDECTSAVDSAMEALFYQTLVDLGGRATQPCARFTENIVARASHVVSHTRRTSRRENAQRPLPPRHTHARPSTRPMQSASCRR